MKRFRSLPALVAAAGFVLALAAAFFIAFSPCFYRGVERTVPVETGKTSANDPRPPASRPKTTCRSFLEVNGAYALWSLALPATMSGMGLYSVLLGSSPVVYLLTLFLVLFSLMSRSSIGLLFLPATVALFIAAATMRKVPDET